MIMIRFCTLAFAALALAACQGNGGAVSVRWRISNLSTGETWDPSTARSNDGSCCSDHDLAGNCDAASIWVVHSVSVILRDPATDAAVPGIEPRTFPCAKRESTTAFDLPAGTFAIGLTASIFDGMNQPEQSIVPPPEVHTIVRGDVVNLQDIEIGVQPLPSASSAVPLPGGTQMVTF
jgi:hypothetical protein